MSSNAPGVPIQDLNLFREGNFNDAATDIKEKWYMVMLDLLPCISKKYTKNIRTTEEPTNNTTVSDEALLLWWLALNSEKWTAMARECWSVDDQDRVDQGNGPPKKRSRKNRGAHESRVAINQYYELCQRISATRKDKTTGEGWDKALIAEAKRRLLVENRVKGKTVPKARVDSYVMCYSPGKEPIYEKITGPVPYEV